MIQLLDLDQTTTAAEPTLDGEPAARADVGQAAAAAGRGETLAVLVALAVIGLAVLDDAFVHREPGTAIGDHLASGLVPVAVVVLLALVDPRMRAGLRATVALVCAPLAIVGGVVAGLRHVIVDRPSGDHWCACRWVLRRPADGARAGGQPQGPLARDCGRPRAPL